MRDSNNPKKKFIHNKEQYNKCYLLNFHLNSSLLLSLLLRWTTIHMYKYITLYVYNKNKAIKRTLKHVGINIKERN